MNKSTREGFGDSLAEYGNNPKIVVIGCDLSKATKTDEFAILFPERFVECGIAESNALGVSAGLAAQGFLPIVSSFGSFITGRADQLKCSIAMPNLPVIVVGSHPGISPSKDGPTQSGLSDLSIMRSLPNLTVWDPGSYTLTYELTRRLLTAPISGPIYLRLGRQPIEDSLVSCPMSTACLGSFNLTEHEADPNFCVLVGGCLLPTVLVAAYKSQLQPEVYHVARIKPLPEQIISIAKKAKIVFTVEDHSIIGGLGSAICEALSETDTHVIRIGIPDEFPSSGSPEDLYKHYRLDVEGLRKRFDAYR